MEAQLGEERLRQGEKQLMMQVLDTLWVRHLTALDALRQSIGLRAYGQQDPLIAFQKEAFAMYGQLREAIQEEVVRRIYHPTIASQAPKPRNIQAVHPNAQAAARMQAETPGATDQAPEPVRVRKVPGRNDPCHCGSGKKYKHCHMKSDLAGGNGSNAQNGPAGQGQSSRPGSKRKKQTKTKARRR
jgi:preprotein translocase subunit SecA